MALLEVDGLSVRRGGHLAVDDASLRVEAGAITGLIGPNGAGKTSLFDAVCGLEPIAAGSVRLAGEELGRLPAHARARKGMARTFQRLETFTHLTVRENIRAGREFSRGGHDAADAEPVAVDALIDRLGLADVAEVRVDRLPTGRARLVEVGRALASGPRLLLLDEPSSGLDQSETEELAGLLRELATDGLAILMVEHDMSLVMGTCDVIYVLELGSVIASGSPAQTQADPIVRAAYLGLVPSDDRSAALGSVPPRPAATIAAARPGGSWADRGVVPLLELNGVSAGHGGIDVISGVSFAVEEGEVFGLLGPNGSGKTTTLNVIAGLLAPTRGQVALCGRVFADADADALARAGVRMVPEGRGIFPNLSVAENLWMSSYTGTDRGTIEERAYARFPRLSPRSHQMAGTLSGGEQQMLAMARALATDPVILVLDELSMGLAPMIVDELYACVAELAGTGVTVVLVEQFAHELLGVADRAAIMLNGRIERIGDPAEIAAELEAAYLSGVASR